MSKERRLDRAMHLVLDLPRDVSIALRRFGFEMDMEYKEAAIAILRNALIATGHMEIIDGIEEDSDTDGNA